METKKQHKWTNIAKEKQSGRHRKQTRGCQRGREWEEERHWGGWLRGTGF